MSRCPQTWLEVPLSSKRCNLCVSLAFHAALLMPILALQQSDLEIILQCLWLTPKGSWGQGQCPRPGLFLLKGKNTQCILALTIPDPGIELYLVNEGSKFVVERLDLLLLISLHPLSIRVNLQVERGQQALVNSHCCDRRGCWDSNSSNSIAKAIAKATAGSKP